MVWKVGNSLKCPATGSSHCCAYMLVCWSPTACRPIIVFSFANSLACCKQSLQKWSNPHETAHRGHAYIGLLKHYQHTFKDSGVIDEIKCITQTNAQATGCYRRRAAVQQCPLPPSLPALPARCHLCE